MAIQPQHVKWDTDPPLLYVAPRRKGTGSSDAWLPLLPQAVDALKAFFAAKATGRFELRVTARALGRAVTRVQRELRQAEEHATAARLNDVTIYTLRHSFLKALAEQTDDIYAVAEYAGHANLQTTRRYMKGAAHKRMAQGIAALGKATDAK